MCKGRPLFPGTSEGDQLKRIFNALGSPNANNVPAFHELPEWPRALKTLQAEKQVPLLDFSDAAQRSDWGKRVVPSLSSDGVQLLLNMLQYDPSKVGLVLSALIMPGFIFAPLRYYALPHL